MLTLEVAQQIVNGAVREQARLATAPLAIAVLDAGGHLVTFIRQDGAGIARFDIAFAKAWGSLGMGFGSRELAERARQNPTFINVLASVTGGRIAPSPGGVLIRDEGGSVIGAVGVSGDLGDKDELCAIAGIADAGLVPIAEAN
jgi:uncharacterized protein GlcG (DUF336 family)